MVIESRTIVGGAAALAIVGGLWVSTVMMSPPAIGGTVEVQQVEEPSWAVEVKEMAQPVEKTATAAVR